MLPDGEQRFGGLFHYVMAVYHISSQNQSVMALRNRRSSHRLVESLITVNAYNLKLLLITGARISGKMLLELIGDDFPFLRVGRRSLLGRDIGPRFCEFGVDTEPLLNAGLGVGLDRVDRAFRLANTAIDALIRMDDQHIFALVKAVDRADLDAIHVFTFDAIVVDDIGHFHTLNGLFCNFAPNAWVRGAQGWPGQASRDLAQIFI